MKLISAAIWGLVLVAMIGCGGPHDATVMGMVTLDGAAVPRGTVTFYPVASGSAAYGRIADDGSYSVRTGREEGLPSGEYEVTVVANEAPKVQPATAGPPPPGRSITPAQYRSRKTSGLKFTISPGTNTIDLALSANAPKG
jgi:hypothetical protein